MLARLFFCFFLVTKNKHTRACLSVHVVTYGMLMLVMCVLFTVHKACTMLPGPVREV